MPLIEVHLIEKTRSSGPPHHRHVLGGAAAAMTEGEGVSLMIPNKHAALQISESPRLCCSACVRCWHKAEIPTHSTDVRFWG